MKNRHKKENKSTKKHRRIFWIFVFFLVVGIGVTSYILLFSAYTRRVEREAMATGTVQEEIYSFKSRRDLLSLTPEVKRAATDVLPKLIMVLILFLDLMLQKHRFSEKKILLPSVLP